MKLPTPCDTLTALRPVQLIGGEQTLFAVTADGKVKQITDTLMRKSNANQYSLYYFVSSFVFCIILIVLIIILMSFTLFTITQFAILDGIAVICQNAVI